MATASSPTEEASPPPDVLSLSQRRKSAQALTPLLLHRDMSTDVCTPEEVQQAQIAGVAVYTEFLEQHLQVGEIPDQDLAQVMETIENHGRTATSSICTSSDDSEEQKSAKLSQWKKKGKRLHQIAIAFEKTHQREEVRQEAQRVVSEGDRISKEQFLQLMEELFAGDCITAHRIVVLFTFCSDVIVYTVKRLATDLFARFLDWAIEYIMTKVCAWVARHGGWDAVLSQPWTYIYAAGKVILAGVFIYFGYRLVKSGLNSIGKK
ncbi:hypothetical protein BSL78_14196 [Apostichopus japonicus]|nr:hypothetical protein BSL78_14196 [Apostichopus japonicus]